MYFGIFVLTTAVYEKQIKQVTGNTKKHTAMGEAKKILKMLAVSLLPFLRIMFLLGIYACAFFPNVVIESLDKNKKKEG